MAKTDRKQASPWPRRLLLLAILAVLAVGVYYLLTAVVFPPAAGAGYEFKLWPERSCDLARMQELAQNNNAFACDFYHELGRSADGNFTYSPFSISLGMAMVYAGAGGTTRQQLADGLHFAQADDELVAAFADQCYRLNTGIGDPIWIGESVHFSSILAANSLWVDQSVELVPAYRQLIDETLNAKIETIDFHNPQTIARRINEWTAAQTLGQVTDYVDAQAIPRDSVMVLVNCLVLNAAWRVNCGFSEDNTKDRPFYLLDGRQVDVPMMKREVAYRVAIADEFVALDMPLEFSERVSFVVILPSEIDGLGKLEAMLSAELLTEIRANLAGTLVELYLPRYCFENSIAAKPALQALGIRDVFGDQADLTGIGHCGINELYLGDVLQASRIEVDETGVKAAAVTQSVILAKCAFMPPPDKIVFRADHPFIFLLQDTETGAILFMGRVLNPLE